MDIIDALAGASTPILMIGWSLREILPWLLGRIQARDEHTRKLEDRRMDKVEELYERLLENTEKMLVTIDKNTDALGRNTDVIESLIPVVYDLEQRVCTLEKHLGLEPESSAS